MINHNAFEYVSERFIRTRKHGNRTTVKQRYVIYNNKCITIHSIYLLFFELSYITGTSNSRILDNHITIEKQSREMHLRVFKRVLLS